MGLIFCCKIFIYLPALYIIWFNNSSNKATMNQTEITINPENLLTLHINGMRGRILSLPHKKKTKKSKSPEILMIYGHHSSLERMYSLATNFSKYGNVTMPDLPGFGGMDSFFVINKEPTIDDMADYLATFIKLYYKKQKLHICGMSYGFLVVTRMLQKYPNITKRTGVVISLVGFSHKSDFKFSDQTYNKLYYGSQIMKGSAMSFVAKNVFITKPVITLTYNMNAKKHTKMKDASDEERKRRINFEVYLWKCNDVKTYFYTSHSFLNVNLTKVKVNKDLHHVEVNGEQYFDNKVVEKNLNKIYNKIIVYTATLPNHAPTVISDEKEAGKILPAKLKKVLKNLPIS